MPVARAGTRGVETAEGSRQTLGQGPPTGGLEPGGGVVGQRHLVLRPRLEPEVGRGQVAVGGGGVDRRVELVDGDHLGAGLAQALGDVAAQRAQPTELADHQAQLAQRGADGPELFQFAHRRHARSGSRPRHR